MYTPIYPGSLYPDPNRLQDPPTKQHPRRKPETELSIATQLLQGALKNPNRIFPSNVPPSTGTPLQGGGVKERGSEEDLEEDGETTWSRGDRVKSKVEQVLGPGAESVKRKVEAERKALKSRTETPVTLA